MSDTIDLTNSFGDELANYIGTNGKNNKYKLFVKSVAYNDKGAYHPLQSGYINLDSCLYNYLNKNDSIKKSFVDYYNHVKDISEKEILCMPSKISATDIEAIVLYILPKNYVEYYNR